MKGDFITLIIGGIIIKNVFFSDPTPKDEPKDKPVERTPEVVVRYKIKMSHKIIDVDYCETKDGLITYKKDGKTLRMFASDSTKCVDMEE